MNIQFCDLKYRKTNSRLKVDLKIKGRKLKVLSLSFFRPKIRKPINIISFSFQRIFFARFK